MQGLLFFAALIVVLTVAELPLDMYDAHCEPCGTASACRAGEAGFGDQAKALGLAVVFGSLVMLLFHWIVRKWPRRYWFGVWVATLPLMVLAVFVSPLIEPLFNKYEPLDEEPCRCWWTKLETGGGSGPERTFRRSACS